MVRAESYADARQEQDAERGDHARGIQPQDADAQTGRRALCSSIRRYPVTTDTSGFKTKRTAVLRLRVASQHQRPVVDGAVVAEFAVGGQVYVFAFGVRS